MTETVHPSRTTNAALDALPRAPQGLDAAFAAVFDSSGEALVLIDSAGAIQRANDRARELLRLREGARKGIESLISSSDQRPLSLQWSAKDASGPRTLDVLLTGGLPLRVTLRSVLPGSLHLLLCVEEGTIAQRAEVRWRRVEAEIRSVLESMQAAVMVCDSSGHLRWSNARFAELFGLEARGIGKISTVEELEDLLAQRFRNPESFAAPWKSFLAGTAEPGHDELEMARPARRVIERFSRPILDSRCNVVGWLEMYSDVTAERQIQAKMLQTEKMAALGQLVSGIAHELNNPLTTIMGYAQLLLGHGLAPGQLSEARKVYQEAERARRIVKNLLYFAREKNPERTHVNFNEIIERTLTLRTYELRVKDIVVECDLAPGLPETMADPYQLQQVVLNLVVNAEQALLEGRGRGHIWIRTRHVIEGLGDQVSDRILLEVSDDGPGIRPDIASRIFDPFFTSKPPGVGTGLGLSIVYGIVHQHKGEVTFESQPGSGAKFVVDLPVTAVPKNARADLPLSPAPAVEAVAASRILVIEDEPKIAQLIVDVLSEEGHQVEAVVDSQEGLTRLSRGRYDLVICDFRMPRLDGQAVHEALVRAGSPIRNRILFMTGDILAPRTLDFLEQNTLPYLAKPFLVEELKLAVNRLLAPTKKQMRAHSGSSC
jgi:signal transduction histidine kinase/CheY-like chemotaxis protein